MIKLKNSYGSKEDCRENRKRQLSKTYNHENKICIKELI